jgi:hypothetical protein
MRSRSGILAFAVVVVAGAAIWWIPWLGHARPIPTSTPAPQGRFTGAAVPLPPHSLLCVTYVPLDPTTQVARFTLGTYGQRGPAVDLLLRAPGYHAHSVLPGGYADNTPIALPITPPPHAVLASLCLSQRGSSRLGLIGTPEPRVVVTTLNGRRLAVTPAISLYAARARTPAERLVPGARIASALLPGWAPPALLVIVLLAAFAAPLLAVGAALWRSAGASEAEVEEGAEAAGGDGDGGEREQGDGGAAGEQRES